MNKKLRWLYYCFLVPGIIILAEGYNKTGVVIMTIAGCIIVYDYVNRK